MMMSTNLSDEKSSDAAIRTSLVGPFSTSITNKSTKSNDYKNPVFSETWTLFRIEKDSKDDEKMGVGSIALNSLQQAAQLSYSDKTIDTKSYELNCHTDYVKEINTLSIYLDHTDVMSQSIDRNSDDYNVLQTIITIIAQRAIFEHYQHKTSPSVKVVIHSTPFLSSASTSSEFLLALEESNEENTSLNEIQQKIASNLFGLEDGISIELVDMVDSNGDPLAIVPRKIVHTFNILHRGIGMVVCKDEHIGPETHKRSDITNNVPMVYCHRRTDTKRIFPSLYDMFIGGVSVTGEESTLTAAREVAEELGLKRALETIEEKLDAGMDLDIKEEDILRGPLFKCTVCTGYNRCVVTMFTYCIDVEKETFKWQEEEVAWGDYVPYNVVKKAGNLSINRLKEQGTWPGEYSELATIEVDDPEADWATWDFVPDGLLVWEAWEKWCKQV